MRNIHRIMKQVAPVIEAAFIHQWNLELIFVYPTDQFEHIDDALHLPSVQAIVRVDEMLDRDAWFDMTISRSDAGDVMDHVNGLFRLTIENLRLEAL